MKGMKTAEALMKLVEEYGNQEFIRGVGVGNQDHQNAARTKILTALNSLIVEFNLMELRMKELRDRQAELETEKENFDKFKMAVELSQGMTTLDHENRQREQIEILKLKAKNNTLKRELSNALDNNHQRNLDLDALHYVWCDGGCRSGVHRFGDHPPLTAELIAAAIRNTERLQRWFTNNAARQVQPAIEARRRVWNQAQIDIFNAQKTVLEKESADLYSALMEYVDWFGAAHTNECPQDDTCDCICKPMNEKITTALQAYHFMEWMF